MLFHTILIFSLFICSLHAFEFDQESIIVLKSKVRKEKCDECIPKYHMTTSDAQNYVWFRNAKVGTRTILHLLASNTVLSINGDWIPFDKNKYHNHFKFAFVRNPWDRVVSAYFNKVVPGEYKYYQECAGKDFDYFVDWLAQRDLTHIDRHVQLQTTLIPLKDLSFLGRFETFERDLRFVLDTIGLYDVEIVKLNSSPNRKHYSEYYTKRTKNIIGKIYKKDIIKLGYKFEEAKEL